MKNPIPELQAAAGVIGAAVRARLHAGTPFLVALDGGSGAGKSTLAAIIAAEFDAALVQGDDFYASDIPDAAWESRTAAERARDVIDWRRLRAEALEPLLTGQLARWRTFDFTGLRPDGTYPMRSDLVECQPAGVIVLDGAYSARPELADLIDLSVLVDVPVAVRHARLAAREAADFLTVWHARWDAAEAYYFAQVRPKSSFDLVVTLY
ncbi:MAG: hypothetical protein IT319_13655 [Anaerolineae bacterium]|nr:hypothetical protein [Anaerolineae bacterium]